MKRCTTLLLIREISVSTAMSYHHIPVRMLQGEELDNTKCCQRSRTTLTLYIAGQNLNVATTLENNMEVTFRVNCALTSSSLLTSR